MTDPAFRTRTLTYGGTPLPVAVMPPDAIDDPAALEQMHAAARAQGLTLALVLGAPYVWRAAGYDYALDWGAGAVIDTVNLPPLRLGLRPMTDADITVAGECFDAGARRLVVAEHRDGARWRDLLAVSTRAYEAIVEPDGAVMGYVAWTASSGTPEMVELAGTPGADVRDLALCALRERVNGPRSIVRLGPRHPVYDVLGGRLLEAIRPGAWYVRVLDLVGLLRTITPALDARLAASLLRGVSSALAVHDFSSAVELVIESGRVVAVAPAEQPPRAAATGAVGAFPPGVFAKVIFGRHLLDEVELMYPDVVVAERARRLLNTLFPAGPSHLDAAAIG